jgi:uroporphyrinogen-III synthase
MHLLVTRPAADAAHLAKALEAMGHTVLVDPLLSITSYPEAPIDLDGAQAVVLTSLNAGRALLGRLEPKTLAGISVFAVGEATADISRQLAAETVFLSTDGKASGLVRLILEKCRPDKGFVVHASGDHLAFDLSAPLTAAGLAFRRVIVYRSAPALRLQPQTRAAFMEDRIDGVVLLSPRTAETYLRLTADLEGGGPSRRVIHFCLSEAVASRLGPSAEANLRVPTRPELNELLALVSEAAAQFKGT